MGEGIGDSFLLHSYERVCRRCIAVNAIAQISTDSREPAAVARPIGYSVAGYICDVRYAPGTRMSTIARKLCMNDRPERPHAQK